MIREDKNGLGRIKIETIPFPDGLTSVVATYTYSGNVLLAYKTADDPSPKNYLNLGVMADDGTGFRQIYSGPAVETMQVNGMRYMPFADNKRILLGSWVVECFPDIDHCQRAELIPIQYPKLFDDGIWLVWTEVIIARDNRHMGWTQLHRTLGSMNFVGELVRQEDHYDLVDARLISSLNYFEQDSADPSILIPQTLRGGEFKQFVHGDTAISLAGACRAGTTDSIIQDMKTEAMWQLTRTGGYDETTLLSLDERLGIVMTARFSAGTDTSVFSLLPRPYGQYMTLGTTLPVYSFAVAGVRSFWEGNVGPALVEVDKAVKDPGYKGVCLAEAENSPWVFCSPMSWKPDSKKVMWLEVERGSICTTIVRRIRVAELLDYQPGEPVALQPFPENIPYAVKAEEIKNLKLSGGSYAGRIPGKKQGYIEYSYQQGKAKVSHAVYHHYSDDGKTFWDGWEHTVSAMGATSTYEAHVQMTGEDSGEMDLRATFLHVSNGARWSANKLSFDMAEDGKPASYGYATYNGKTLRVEDLLH